ncbi:hypothetical protein CHU98_g6426 [Xylaria longipes]|nr:hypothetical protein CHU98_g6426 [Xylaria longipes]
MMWIRPNNYEICQDNSSSNKSSVASNNRHASHMRLDVMMHAHAPRNCGQGRRKKKAKFHRDFETFHVRKGGPVQGNEVGDMLDLGHLVYLMRPSNDRHMDGVVARSEGHSGVPVLSEGCSVGFRRARVCGRSLLQLQRNAGSANANPRTLYLTCRDSLHEWSRLAVVVGEKNKKSEIAG